jgi:hypothetical protein
MSLIWVSSFIGNAWMSCQISAVIAATHTRARSGAVSKAVLFSAIVPWQFHVVHIHLSRVCPQLTREYFQ